MAKNLQNPYFTHFSKLKSINKLEATNINSTFTFWGNIFMHIHDANIGKKT